MKTARLLVQTRSNGMMSSSRVPARDPDFLKQVGVLDCNGGLAIGNLGVTGVEQVSPHEVGGGGHIALDCVLVTGLRFCVGHVVMPNWQVLSFLSSSMVFLHSRSF